MLIYNTCNSIFKNMTTLARNDILIFFDSVKSFSSYPKQSKTLAPSSSNSSDRFVTDAVDKQPKSTGEFPDPFELKGSAAI